jgi:lactosylceramide 4-alpha-galactosyltransferase
MLSYPNVRIWKLVISDYIKGTPLETWDFMAKVRSSKWPVVHASDILRIITLWKYGGTYLDMDFVIQKSLVELGTNYAGSESERDMANGVLNFDMDTAGRTATDLMLTDVRRNFNGEKWTQNGPKVILRVLQSLCRTEHVTKTTREKCLGIAVLPPSVFFSIYYTSWKLFFNESRSDEVLMIVNGSYGVHVWNKLSSQEKIFVGSKQAYGLLAEKYCPRVYWNSGPVF